MRKCSSMTKVQKCFTLVHPSLLSLLLCIICAIDVSESLSKSPIFAMAQETARPSIRPSMQPSDRPSSQPSVNPSIQPSDQPSSHPSINPSIQPSDQPSSRPSINPSIQPSDQPSSRPSIGPSIQPSNHPSSKPSTSSAPSISLEPSAQPSISHVPSKSSSPSVKPTSKPSSRPSTTSAPSLSLAPSGQPSISYAPSKSSPPTISAPPSFHPSSRPSITSAPSASPSISMSPTRTPVPYCFNEEDYLVWGNEDKPCSWVAQNTAERCAMYTSSPMHPVQSYVFEHCRQTCQKCVCLDDPSFIGNKFWKTCKYVSKKPKIRCSNRVPGATEACHKSCSDPSELECCKNNLEFRYKGQEKKSCQWVARFRTEKRCKRPEIAFNCPIACSLCNYRDYRKKRRGNKKNKESNDMKHEYGHGYGYGYVGNDNESYHNHDTDGEYDQENVGSSEEDYDLSTGNAQLHEDIQLKERGGLEESLELSLLEDGYLQKNTNVHHSTKGNIVDQELSESFDEMYKYRKKNSQSKSHDHHYLDHAGASRSSSGDVNGDLHPTTENSSSSSGKFDRGQTKEIQGGINLNDFEGKGHLRPNHASGPDTNAIRNYDSGIIDGI